ncbi:MAG: hypothetical protein STSR0009_24610 [Methanoregula sp.]
MNKLIWLVVFALAVFVVVGCIGFPGPGSPEKLRATVVQPLNDTFQKVSREPILTPVYLGSLSSAKMFCGDDLRVPEYLPPEYYFCQGSVFTGTREKTQLTFKKGADVIHIFQGESIEPAPYFVINGEPEPVSIREMAGEWIPGRDPGQEKPFNQIQWKDAQYAYWIQSPLDKNEMIKIAGSLTPITDELIRQIPGPETEGKQK